MSHIPPVELLKATHSFPGPYLFKAIGESSESFVARFVAAVREEMSYEEDPPFETRETTSGRHVAVTIEVWVENPERVLAIYERILKIPGLVISL